jgi:uncharacterized BrkB/YihY/UPF0761 family membrane protein
MFRDDNPYTVMTADDKTSTGRSPQRWRFRPIWTVLATVPIYLLLILLIIYPLGLLGLGRYIPQERVILNALLFLAFLISSFIMGRKPRKRS